jgi:hypothetical protein
VSLDRAFTSELTRSAAHLCDRLEAPSADPSERRSPRDAHRGARGPRRRPPRPRPPARARRSRSNSRASTARSRPPAPPAPATPPRSPAAARTSATARSRWRSSRPQPPSDSRPPVIRTYVPARLASDEADVDAWAHTQRVTEAATSPRPDSARTAGGRDVRAVQLNRDAVPARATAFGTAPAPRAPRAQADAHPHRTLATRAEPKPPPPCRPQSATGVPCAARPHPSSPAQPPPLRRRVRPWRLTTLATTAYPQQQTHASRSLLVEGQHNEALAALLPSTRSPAPRGTPRRSLRGPPGRRVELPAASLHGRWHCPRRALAPRRPAIA